MASSRGSGARRFRRAREARDEEATSADGVGGNGPRGVCDDRARAEGLRSAVDAERRSCARLGARDKRGYNEGLAATRFFDGGRGVPLL
jgi:hypothetical protein